MDWLKKTNKIINLTGCAMNLKVLSTGTKGVHVTPSQTILTKYQEKITITAKSQSPVSTYLHQYMLPPPKNLEVTIAPPISIKKSAAYATLDICQRKMWQLIM